MNLAKDWMTKDVKTISKENNLMDATILMREHDIGDLIVIENDMPIGIITERDVCQKLVAEDLKPSDIKVEQIMTQNLTFAKTSDQITEVSRRMSLGKIKKMPIIEDNKLVGIITTTDIRKVIASMQKDIIGIVENV